jgi:predicted metal-dependent hydrolase
MHKPAASELPAYTVRVSERARHVRLTVSRDGEVVVVVPRRFSIRLVPEIVATRAEWIALARARALERRAMLAEAHGEGLPAVISLTALGETWQVEYRATSSASVCARTLRGCRLTLSGAVDDRDACAAALRRWLLRQAHTGLARALAEISASHGLPHATVRFRWQRTRWGSCSAKGGISLNAKLLFLPEHLARYVMLHELCHTLILDHSPRFWALLGQHDPSWRRHRRELRESWLHVPHWVE